MEEKLIGIKKRCLARMEAGSRAYPRKIQKKNRTDIEEREVKDARILKKLSKKPPAAGKEKALWDEIMSMKIEKYQVVPLSVN